MLGSAGQLCMLVTVEKVEGHKEAHHNLKRVRAWRSPWSTSSLMAEIIPRTSVLSSPMDLAIRTMRVNRRMRKVLKLLKSAPPEGRALKDTTLSLD
eukprot:829386-Amphidinium_carterae.2